MAVLKLSPYRLDVRLNGRARRLPYFICVFLSISAFLAIAIYQQTMKLWSFEFYAAQFCLLLVLPLKFWLAGGRLHDMDRSMLWTLPYMVIFVMGSYNQWLVPLFRSPSISLDFGRISIFGHAWPSNDLIGLGFLAFVALSDLALIVLPGSKGRNRFGPDPRWPADEAEHF